MELTSGDRMQPEIRLSMHIQPDPSDEELLFARQLGVDCVYTWVKEDQCDYGFLSALRERVEAAGLILYNVGNMSVAKSDKIHLALDGRDDVIERFQGFVRNLGRAGIHTTTFTWEPTQVWSSEPGVTRSARTRRVDLDEIWDNYTYFVRRMIPVAEAADVRLALHPNDPPAPELGGIPCLIHSWEDYDRVFSIADSP